MQDLIKKINEEVKKVQNEEFEKKEVFQTNFSNELKHEFLFFIKPEITIKDENIKLDNILTLIFKKLEQFNLKIININILSAKYLDKNNIMAQHYGIINQLSQNPKENLSQTAIQTFENLYNISLAEANIIGSLELMKKDNSITVAKLEELVNGVEIQKLAGGTYVQKINLDGKETYIINSFHPKQLMHFIESKRSIITFTLAGNTDWNIARTDLIGSTNPPVAKDGSIRKELYTNKSTLGLADISYSLNGVHLSAGPIEGLIELIRFNSDFENNIKPPLSEFNMGKLLIDNFNQKQIEIILSNPDFEYEGKKQSIFDITEEKNADEAISILKSLNI